MGKQNDISVGIEVSGCKSIAEVLDVSGTNWAPTAQPAAFSMPDEAGNIYDDADGFQAIVRPDTRAVLGMVRGKYKTQDHRAQLFQLDGLVSSGELVPENVNIWDRGEMLAYQFRAPKLDMLVDGGGLKDMVSPLLTLAFFHNGQGSDLAFFADFRWFCKNQMGKVASLNKGNERAVHKGENAAKYADMIHSHIEELGGALQGRYAAMRKMRDVRLPTGEPLYRYWAAAMGCNDPKLIAEECTGKSVTGKLSSEAKSVQAIGASYMADDCGAPGTLWHAYNAVTRHLTHGSLRETETGAARRLQRALLGPGKEFTSAFFEALKLAA